MTDKKIKIYEVDSVPQLIGMLNRDRIEYFVGKAAEVQFYIKNKKYEIQDYGAVGPYQEVYFALSKKSKKSNLYLKKLNNTLKEMDKDGTLKKISDLYLK